MMEWQDQVHWHSGYSVGHPVLDAQHKKLQWLCHAATYYLGDDDGDPSERCLDVLHDLQIFAKEHFRTEERILEEAGYPQLAEHIAEHEAYQAKLAETLEQVRSGQAAESLIGPWLQQWWLHHTLVTDKHYEDLLRAQQA